MEPNNSSRTRVITVVIVVIVAIAAIAYALLAKKAAAPTESPSTSSTASSTALATTSVATSSAASSSEYKDGTYTAVGSYQSPGGDEKISVTVTLKDDVITAASVIPEPVSAEGKEMQAQFAKGFQALVVGKDINDVHLSAVSGSSLTPIGFQNALTQIEQQAKA